MTSLEVQLTVTLRVLTYAPVVGEVIETEGANVSTVKLTKADLTFETASVALTWNV